MFTSPISRRSRRFWIAPYRSSRAARSSSCFPAANRPFPRIFSKPWPMPRRSASIESWRPPTASGLPRARNSRARRARPGCTAPICSSTAPRNEKNQHRGVANLFDVKLQAIENMARVGMKTTLVTTIVNTVNKDAVGPIVDFAVSNIDKVQTVVFQPISFTGRDEDIDDETRYAQRYTAVSDGGRPENPDCRRTGNRCATGSRCPPTAPSPASWISCRVRRPPGAGAPATAIRIAECSACWSSTGARRNGFRCSSFSTTSVSSAMCAIITDTARGKTLTEAQLGSGHPAQLPGGAGSQGISHLADPQSLPADLGKVRQRPERPHEDALRSKMSGACCAWKGCGSRTCGRMISGAPKCA